MAQTQTEYDHPELLEQIEGRDVSDEVKQFVDSALDVVYDVLEQNRIPARNMGADIEKSVGDVLSPDNIEHISIRSEPLENPMVAVWLKECPMWANDAWRETHYPRGINAYNGKVQTVFDVRQF